jgi:LAO/AO transport system kinase
MLDALLERFRKGDRQALSRLLSLLARGQETEAIGTGVGPAPRPSRVVAVTGGGGVGKSTLIGRLIEYLRGRGLKVAVLACDPQSPVSGGALLGDRFRMPSRPEDDGVFIRSLAAAGGHGAVAEHLPEMVRLLEAFGFDVILIETVGAGQGDTAVYDLVDVVVLLLQPETGDDLQWEKAGLLEVADVIVIHKADLPGAENVEAQVRAALDLPGARPVPLVRVSAKRGQGVEELWAAVAVCPLRRGLHPGGGQHLLRLAQDSLAARYKTAATAHDARLSRLIADWQEGRLSEPAAVHGLLVLLAAEDGTKPLRSSVADRKESLP